MHDAEEEGCHGELDAELTEKIDDLGADSKLFGMSVEIIDGDTGTKNGQKWLLRGLVKCQK